MCDIDEIMSMLDWNNNMEIQQKGRELAKNIKNINAFMLPMHPGCNKNVWENCAKILAQKPDEILMPYLGRLLEWIEDANWPGALIIAERLKTFSKIEELCFDVRETVKIASATNNHMWLVSLAELLDNEKLNKSLPPDVLDILKFYYHNFD